MKETVIVGKLTKRIVHDDYIVCRVDADGNLVVTVAAGGGFKADLRQVLGQGADLSPANPLLADIIDRAGRLVGIVYGENAQLQQLTPADAVSPNESLEAAGFLMVYDPVAGDWNRVREGAGVGQVLTDVADRWARLLGAVDLARVLGAPLTAANPVIAGIFDAAGNRMPAMDVAARPGYVDPIDRAARLLGIVYGEAAQLQQLTPADAVAPNQSLESVGFPMVYDPVGGDWNRLREGAAIGQALVDLADRAARLVGIVYGNQAALQQVPGTLELITQDTGLNTNPERWLHDNHWEADEVTIAVAGAPGEQNLGVVVPGGVTRRIRELTIRHEGTLDTVVTLLISGGATKVTIRMPPQSERVWSSQDGREFDPAEQSAVQTSDVTGGSTYVSAAGVEA